MVLFHLHAFVTILNYIVCTNFQKSNQRRAKCQVIFPFNHSFIFSFFLFPQSYFLPKEKMTETLEEHPELANRLWRVCGVRIAVPLLMDILTYHNWTKDKIRLMCERSYLWRTPPQAPNAVFRISPMMQEALLIRGHVTCSETREVFEGPAILPKVHKTYKLHYEKEPKILVIVRVNENPISEDVGDTPSALDLVGKFFLMSQSD